MNLLSRIQLLHGQTQVAWPTQKGPCFWDSSSESCNCFMKVSCTKLWLSCGYSSHWLKLGIELTFVESSSAPLHRKLHFEVAFAHVSSYLCTLGKHSPFSAHGIQERLSHSNQLQLVHLCSYGRPIRPRKKMPCSMRGCAYFVLTACDNGFAHSNAYWM